MASIPQSGQPGDISYLDASNVPRPRDARAEVRAIAGSAFIEEAEILHASLRAGSVAQIVVAIIAIIGLLYLLKYVMVTILIALLLAFILEPLVHLLNSIAIPRAAGAFLAVVFAAGLAGGVGYFLCGRLGAFVAELPKYSDRIQRTLRHIQEPMSRLEKNTSSMPTPSVAGKQPVTVRIEEEPIFSRIVTDNGAAIGKTGNSLDVLFLPGPRCRTLTNNRGRGSSAAYRWMNSSPCASSAHGGYAERMGQVDCPCVGGAACWIAPIATTGNYFWATLCFQRQLFDCLWTSYHSRSGGRT